MASRLYQDLMIEALQLVNAKSGGLEIIEELLLFFRTSVPVDAVAIRLSDEEDFPYFSSVGFPPSFLKGESSLCSRGAEGGIVRDTHDRAVLDCMCGLVIRGEHDPKKPFFTSKGSFWTNSTSDLLASNALTDLPVTIRCTCNDAGYESIMLVPIKSNGDNIGLLQLNDIQRERFTPELVDTIEKICETIGSTLLRCRTEAHKRNEIRLNTVLEMAGATCHEINQPLQVLFGNLEMINSNIVSPGDDQYDSVLAKLYESALRIRDLSRKLQGLTHYKKKSYAGSSSIIDFEQSKKSWGTEKLSLGGGPSV